MILGLGCDIMDTARMKLRLEEDPQLTGSLFTSAEIQYCETQRYPERHFAARFAAKEALLKALPGPKLCSIPWREIESAHDQNGRPQLHLTGSLRELALKLSVSRIHLSLSHTKDSALAVVMLEA
ncbi:holo-ACP synthase [bacterium]|nr:holo-ACP synthase [bacterium]